MAGVPVGTSVVERVLSDKEKAAPAGGPALERNTHSPCVSGDTLLGLHGREGTRDLRRGLAPAGAVDSNDAGDTDLCSVVTAFIAALGTWWSRFEKKKKGEPGL